MNTPDLGLPDVQAIFRVWQSGAVFFIALLLAAELLLRTSEWWASRNTAKPRNLLPDNAIVNLLANSAYSLTLSGVGYAAILGLGLWLYGYSHWRIPLNWWTLPAYVLVAEFWNYFWHRLMHEIRLFWADHSVHHSATELDFTTTQRFHLFEWVPKTIAMLPLAMIGFHPVLLLLFKSTNTIQLICHTDRFGRWGWWDRYFVSPTIHGIHHSRNPIYMDKNMGGAMNIWDRLFGTFQMPTAERMVFGVNHAPGSTNLIKVLFWEYTFLWRDFAQAPTLKAKLVVLFGRPGETFEAPFHAAGANRKVQPGAVGDAGFEPA